MTHPIVGDLLNDKKAPPSRPTARKPYRRPRLVRLGTLTELTANINSASGDIDNVHSAHKTHA